MSLEKLMFCHWNKIKNLLLAFTLMLLLMGSIAYAQTEGLPAAGILPGNPFYFLKTASEGIGTFFTFGSIAKAERFIYLAEKRLAEAQALSERGDSEMVITASEKYQDNLNKMSENLDRAKADGKNVDNVLVKIAENSLKHQAVLARVYEKAPKAAKATLERVMEEGARGYESAAKSILEERRGGEVEEKIRQSREEGRPDPVKDNDEEIDNMEDNDDEGHDLEPSHEEYESTYEDQFNKVQQELEGSKEEILDGIFERNNCFSMGECERMICGNPNNDCIILHLLRESDRFDELYKDTQYDNEFENHYDAGPDDHRDNESDVQHGSSGLQGENDSYNNDNYDDH